MSHILSRLQNKTKWIWIYDRKKRRYKAQRTRPDVPTQDHTRRHIMPHTAMQYHNVPLCPYWIFKIFFVPCAHFLFPCTFFVPLHVFCSPAHFLYPFKFCSIWSIFAHYLTPKKKKNKNMWIPRLTLRKFGPKR